MTRLRVRVRCPHLDDAVQGAIFEEGESLRLRTRNRGKNTVPMASTTLRGAMGEAPSDVALRDVERWFGHCGYGSGGDLMNIAARVTKDYDQALRAVSPKRHLHRPLTITHDEQDVGVGGEGDGDVDVF